MFLSFDKTLDRISKKWLRRIAVALKCGCHYCGKTLDRGNVTIDHLNPKAKGGQDEVRNYAVCCLECNGKRGHLSIEDFRNQKMNGNTFFFEKVTGRPRKRRVREDVFSNTRWKLIQLGLIK